MGNQLKTQQILGLALMLILLSGRITTAQNDTLAFPPDTIAEMQAKFDDLTAGRIADFRSALNYASEFDTEVLDPALPLLNVEI